MSAFSVLLWSVPVLAALSMLLDRRSQHAGDVAMLAAYTAAAFAGALVWR